MILHKIFFFFTKPEMWLQKTSKRSENFTEKPGRTQTSFLNFIADLHMMNGFFLWRLRSHCLSLLKISLMNHHMAYYKYVLSLHFLYWRRVLKKKSTLPCYRNICWVWFNAIVEAIMPFVTLLLIIAKNNAIVEALTVF